MENVYKKCGYILGFLILVLFVQQTCGDKVSMYFVGLTLISVAVLNADEISSYITGLIKEG